MKFFKYNASGNDFILLLNESINSEWVKKYSHRHFGIGADGVFVIKHEFNQDGNKIFLEMFNSDGSIASMCANGSRASIHFAKHILGLNGEVELQTKSGGSYSGYFQDGQSHLKFLKAPEILNPSMEVAGFRGAYIDSGCEHFAIELESKVQLDNFKVQKNGAKVRYDKVFKNGVNVNFYFVDKNNEIYIRTYEKGCEKETFSCGTGISAVATYLNSRKKESMQFKFNSKGGELFFTFKEDFALYFGEVSLVYTGIIS